ncbi:metallophosphoesterase family protein [Cecembia calidifontis]|uniref:Calcineurin-like phosphoesterase family protein n=1 Tax=Cecembia calidifontis TaxID=1187080 RepID=A0A4Q7PE10_9BACT|nr:metallophosphoesterase [Cecembia calidifontis]RZS98621.1 calcineurin-like phosphoesterase family protein [Cecembia calidifontis]
MKNKISRRNLLHVLGLGAFSTSMLPLSCAAPNQADEKKQSPVLRFAYLTDMHIKPGLGAEEGVKNCINHILSKEEPVDFFVNGGDLIMDALDKNEEETEAQWAVWREIRATFPELKFYHCIGNHDVWGRTPQEEKFPGKAWVMKEHGMDSPYYSFESNGWHFIVLDSTHQKEDGSWYTAKLDMAQREWLEDTLKKIPSDKPIFIISHIPILGATPFLDGDNAKTGNWIVPGAWMHTDAKSLINLFFQHKNVKACISGHIHLVESLVYQNVHYHCSGAVSGNWWDDAPYEQTNKGYGLIELFEDGSHNFKYVEYASAI